MPKSVPAALAAAFFCGAVFLSGCSTKPTFPGDRLPESVKKICKDVSNLDVEADLNGNTLGVCWVAGSIMSEDGKGISDDVNNRLADLAMSVSRAALSTDRLIDFVVVSIRGSKEKAEFQVVRRVDDIRRGYAEALSVPESINRTLQNTKPYDPDKIGQSRFRVDNWTLEDFVAKLILQRVRAAKPVNIESPIPAELYDGKYFVDEQGRRVFEFAILALSQSDPKENLATVLRMIREVFAAYRYDNFDQIVIRDLIRQKQLVIGRSTMKIFEANKITEDELISTRLVADTGRSNTLKSALEVFGFKVS